jgi:rare lipoprotein A
MPAAAEDFLAGVVSIDVTMTRDPGETCIASQYGVGDGYHARRMASGARFNTYP